LDKRIRHSCCDSPAVACRHAEIVLIGEEWLLQPVSAHRTVRNPTLLNGQPVVVPCKLAHGDTIILGAPLRALPVDPVSAHAEALPEDSHAQDRKPMRSAAA
jgi:pSer/pThr/pTyr-binding forkhead associated (FHA) protein